MLLGQPPVWVCGETALAERVVAGLRRERRRVRLVTADRLAGIQPGDCRTLVLAQPPGVDALLLQIAKRIGAPRRGPPLRLILLHPAHPPPTLPPPLADLDPEGPLLLETFALEDRAARSLLARWPLHFGIDPVYGQRPHLLFAGFAAPARALMVQALRLIHYDAQRPRVTVLAADPDACAAAFNRAYPQAGQVADVLWSTFDRPNLDGAPPVTQVLVCAERPALGLELARTLARRIAAGHGASPPVLLEVGDTDLSGEIADWDGQVIPFSYLEEACRPQVLLDGEGDRLAQTIHAYYTDSIAAQGRDPTTEPAGRPWARLAISYRDANRHQADHLWAKLAVTDCRAVPEEQVESFAFAPLEAERMAIIEHLRWSAERYLDGWTYSPQRDNRRKHHPQLVPYASLSEPMKDLDRFAVRGVPALLARSGLGVVRMLILGLTEPAPDCPDGPSLRRLADQALERLLGRYPDRSLVLASTLADPRARQIVRRALDSAGAGLFLLCPRPLAETLAAQPDAPARRDLLELAARAERRIGLPGPGQPEHWLSRRSEIILSLGPDSVDIGIDKRVVLDSARRRLEWSFEY